MVVVEVFCGSGRLSASLKREGFDAFGVDHMVSRQAACSVLKLDLCSELDRAHLWSLVRDPAVRFVHFTPPRGTANRARDIRFEGASVQLRSPTYPEGVPGLHGVQALRVSKANSLYSLVFELCQFCIKHHKFFAVTNPRRSYLWELPTWRAFLQQPDVFQTEFHHCEYGGLRQNATKLVHNVPVFAQLFRKCSGNHVHLGWRRVSSQRSAGLEAVYPWGFTKVMAALLREHFLELGAVAPATHLLQAQPSVQTARAFSGLQSRKRLPPLLSEFHSVHSVLVPHAHADLFLVPGRKLLHDWYPPPSVQCRPPCAVLPAGSRILRSHVLHGDSQGELKSGYVESSPSTDMVRGSSDPEVLAQGLLKKARLHRSDVVALLDLLPSENLDRWSADGYSSDSDSKSFQAGGYVHGGVNGVRTVTKKYPLSVKVICRYVADLFPGLLFGTVGLFRNVLAQVHSHANTEMGTENCIAALSSFKGGEVWMADPSGDVAMDYGGRDVQGVRVPVDAAGFRFDGHRLHATWPWVGRRDVVVAYMPRGMEKLRAEDKAFLVDSGFRLEKGGPKALKRGGSVVKVVVGVYRTPEQFVQEAVKLGHPTELASLVPPELKVAIEHNLAEGEAEVAKERTAILREWIAWSSELAVAEESLKEDMPPFRKQVLERKRLLVFKRALESIGHEDVGLVDDISRGFDLTGKLPRSNVFLNKFRPAEQSEAQLRKGAKRLRDGLLATVRSSGDPAIDGGVLEATRKELARGLIEGPVPISTLPETASLTHRFGVHQGQTEEGPRIRPIDNYLSSQVNASVTQVEQVPVHTIDIVAGVLMLWVRTWLSMGGLGPSCPYCKAWDLRSAYKQLPLSDVAFALDSFFVIFNCESGGPEIFRQRVLPFGSKASVTGFIRCAFALWRLGVKRLRLVWSVFFDDYLSVCGKEFTKHNDLVITMFFKIFGWDVAVDKSLSYSSLCVVLGVQLNLSDAKLGLAFIGNTPKRREETLTALEAALQKGELDPKTCEKLRGRLQFASCQVFGRRPKAALKQLGAHGRRRQWKLSDETRRALNLLKELLATGRPRALRATAGKVFHVYVDAAFEPNGFSGIGGLVVGKGGQILAWFGEQILPEDLSRLRTTADGEKETVIFELEALALALSIEVFKAFLKDSSTVFFTDNEGVFGTFVRGHSEVRRCAQLLDFFCQREEELGVTCWLERVPSASNPADAPSRGEIIKTTGQRLKVSRALMQNALQDVFL